MAEFSISVCTTTRLLGLMESRLRRLLFPNLDRTGHRRFRREARRTTSTWQRPSCAQIMKTEISKTKTARLLASFIRYADEKDSIEKHREEFFEEIGALYANGNVLNQHIYELSEAGIVYYEEIGEDGFTPIIMVGCTKQTAGHLAGLLKEIEDNFESLRRRINEILTFDPDSLKTEIYGAEEKLGAARKSAEKSELLGPLIPQIAEIENYLNGVSAVADKYEDVYKNIIRPVQLEGKSGVKATVRWAIISIFVSTAISVLLGNWKEVLQLIKSLI